MVGCGIIVKGGTTLTGRVWSVSGLNVAEVHRQSDWRAVYI
jgi:hypothetical protein